MNLNSGKVEKHDGDTTTVMATGNIGGARHCHPASGLAPIAGLWTLSLLLATPALSDAVFENASGGSVRLYGHVNPAFLYFDDGVQTYDNLTDSSHSVSRIGMRLLQPYDIGTFGFWLETNLGAPQSANFSQTGDPGWNWRRTNIRRVDLSLVTANWGSFYAGQGSMATDGVADLDLSNTWLANANSIGDTAGSFQFRTTAGVLSGIAIDDAMPSLNGTRRARIRYDTPSFSGFTVSAAYGEEVLQSNNDDTFYDAALVYQNTFANGTELVGGIGWSRRESPGLPDRDDTTGALSILLPSGLNFSFAAGSRNTGGDYAYGKIGFIGDWFSVGTTAFSIDYYDGSDFTVTGASANSFGAGLVQQFDAARVQAYLAYRTYEYADATATYLDASSIFFGARWDF
ncbi:porin [Sedimentitalea sp. JM2-8]|uniref:Porin n=1 Tax=Sedimentitalea xiamensis TaxID=3050037 RepID=A0ABT7FHZ2_9RHOB|nr:porin [Sedimentitalea xiamensis]MDK3074670.1 porin [Sedimentitalea xiamensis]